MDLPLVAGFLGLVAVTGTVSWWYFRGFIHRVETASIRSWR